MVRPLVRALKKLIIRVLDWFIHSVLSDKQKRFIAGLIPDKQKNSLKKNVEKYGTIQAQQTKLQQIKYYLYNLGFTEKGLFELETFYGQSKEGQIKRKIAWELALWHANCDTEAGAERALTYLDATEGGERDADQLRRMAIIKAECYEHLQQLDEAKRVITEALKRAEHPDLYLAAANLESSIDERLQWMNKAYDVYALQPIEFTSHNPTYDDLKTVPFARKNAAGPKVSVILPAYNAGEGIRIAIESILSQTWQNLELLVVDDCSPDDTVEIVKAYMKQDERVKRYTTPENGGPYIARNIGLEAATGEFVTVNDADDWSHAEKIERQVTYLINHPTIMANTSEHARLTEGELKLYRRGTPGRYIFPNMSSFMFRREEVIEKLGYWDSVRFAGDGEFKRRLIRVFGKQAIVDVQTGPLSLPRQSESSLTGSSAFGYNGFFKGVRKEYVESLEYHHDQTSSFFYPFPMESRPFPVPEPMWPRREDKPDGHRYFAMVICADFRLTNLKTSDIYPVIEALINKGKRIGLIQMYRFDLTLDTVDIKPDVRTLLDGNDIHMLVYGEQIKTEHLWVMNHAVLTDAQQYIPHVQATYSHVYVEASEAQQPDGQTIQHMTDYFATTGTWYTDADTTKENLLNEGVTDVHSIDTLNKTWEQMTHDAT